MQIDANHRRLGRTDQVSFIVGLGGITLMPMEHDAAVRLGHEAIDAGVNHFDVAPTYGDAQAKMGYVLCDRRDEVFLSCKTAARDAAGAKAELDESLRLLQTDRIDLYQFHALDTDEDLDVVTGPGGALEVFLEARKAGIVRYLGVTGHYPKMHLKTIERIELDTVMAPLNFRTCDVMCGPGGLIEKARGLGMGVMAIKATTRGELKPTEDAYRFTLSQDIDITMPAGKELWDAVEIGKRFRPMDDAEQQKFLAHCRENYELAKRF
ncbi:MAG: aldo/keto reductase [Planctomycetes bacterium]|nr:aldo/keto reductase [Planctomycetota bacterium]